MAACKFTTDAWKLIATAGWPRGLNELYAHHGNTYKLKLYLHLVHQDIFISSKFDLPEVI